MDSREYIWYYAHWSGVSDRPRVKREIKFLSSGLHAKKEMDAMDRKGNSDPSPYSIFNGPYLRVKQTYDPWPRFRKNFSPNRHGTGIKEQWVAEWAGWA